MKNIIKKADEMEMAINLKAARNAWVFLEIAIIVYCLITAVTTDEFPTIMFLFANVSGVIFWQTKLWETKRLTRMETDDDEE